jgi:hypothetical protein
MILLLAFLAVAAPSPSPTWRAAHSNVYQLSVPAGATRALVFPIPAALVGAERPMTFSWTIIRPQPAPRLLVLEQCKSQDQCYPSVMRPNGQATGTTKTMFRVTNRGWVTIEVQFRYVVWEAK